MLAAARAGRAEEHVLQAAENVAVGVPAPVEPGALPAVPGAAVAPPLPAGAAATRALSFSYADSRSTFFS